MISKAFLTLAMTATLSFAQAASAQNTPEEKGAALFEALQFPALIAVMQEEGVAYGDQIAEDLFAGRKAGDWDDIVAAIYDYDTMATAVKSQLIAAVADDDIDAMLAFFGTEPGKSFVNLEVSARRALLDDAVAEASKESAAIAMADRTPRFTRVEEFVTINDLIETNVVGALNSNYAFYLGLLAGGGLPTDLSQDDILADVWAQEGDIRKSTTEWLYSFLMMAYQPMSDADLDAYIAFSQTEAGKDLNAAMFESFDGVYENISHALGLASSLYLTGQEL